LRFIKLHKNHNFLASPSELSASITNAFLIHTDGILKLH